VINEVGSSPLQRNATEQDLFIVHGHLVLESAAHHPSPTAAPDTAQATTRARRAAAGSDEAALLAEQQAEQAKGGVTGVQGIFGSKMTEKSGIWKHANMGGSTGSQPHTHRELSRRYYYYGSTTE
jgi:hypothetical protein